MCGVGGAVFVARHVRVGKDLTLEVLTGGAGGFLGPASYGTLGSGSCAIPHTGPLVIMIKGILYLNFSFIHNYSL